MFIKTQLQNIKRGKCKLLHNSRGMKRLPSLNVTSELFHRRTQELTERRLTPKHVASHAARKLSLKNSQNLSMEGVNRHIFSLWVLKLAAGGAGGQTDDEPTTEKAADHFQ